MQKFQQMPLKSSSKKAKLLNAESILVSVMRKKIFVLFYGYQSKKFLPLL